MYNMCVKSILEENVDFLTSFNPQSGKISKQMVVQTCVVIRLLCLDMKKKITKTRFTDHLKRFWRACKK